MRKLIILVAAAMLAVLALPTGAGSQTGDSAQGTGTVEGWPHCVATMSFDFNATSGTNGENASGVFSFQCSPSGSVFGGIVSCLTANGIDATLGGTITASNNVNFAVGLELSFTVRDGGPGGTNDGFSVLVQGANCLHAEPNHPISSGDIVLQDETPTTTTTTTSTTTSTTLAPTTTSTTTSTTLAPTTTSTASTTSTTRPASTTSTTRPATTSSTTTTTRPPVVCGPEPCDTPDTRARFDIDDQGRKVQQVALNDNTRLEIIQQVFVDWKSTQACRTCDEQKRVVHVVLKGWLNRTNQDGTAPSNAFRVCLQHQITKLGQTKIGDGVPDYSPMLLTGSWGFTQGESPSLKSYSFNSNVFCSTSPTNSITYHYSGPSWTFRATAVNTDNIINSFSTRLAGGFSSAPTAFKTAIYTATRGQA